MVEIEKDKESLKNALLVTVRTPEISCNEIEELQRELEELSRTLGVKVADKILLNLNKPKPRYFIGQGNVEDLVGICKEKKVNTLIFNNVLTPSQQRNLENISKTRVIDRHELILDIFAARASTREAVLQVDLARTQYLLPRLKRAWTHLSRQQGGVGIRGGEGEKQIEVDERIVRQKITKLKHDLANVRKRRLEQRKKRQKKPVPNAAIVGYTNAGKSSLLNYVSKANSLVENKLFATLDPTIRRLHLENNQTILLSDTVGFIRKLPHRLIEAFKATLEEAALADFLIHVIDTTSPYLQDHITTTLHTLQEIGAEHKFILTVFNKIDLVKEDYVFSRLLRNYPDAVFISTKTGKGIPDLLKQIEHFLNQDLREMTLKIPQDRYHVIALLHRTSTIKSKKYEDNSIYVTASVPENCWKELKPFSVICNNGPSYS